MFQQSKFQRCRISCQNGDWFKYNWGRQRRRFVGCMLLRSKSTRYRHSWPLETNGDWQKNTKIDQICKFLFRLIIAGKCNCECQLIFWHNASFKRRNRKKWPKLLHNISWKLDKYQYVCHLVSRPVILQSAHTSYMETFFLFRNLKNLLEERDLRTYIKPKSTPESEYYWCEKDLGIGLVSSKKIILKGDFVNKVLNEYLNFYWP